MMLHSNVVYFAHGKDSGPWGTKILALAQVAKAKGFHIESPDYSSSMDPEARVRILLEIKPQAARHLVLVGSSMGGYVSAVASAQLNVAGIFLLAPAFFRPKNYSIAAPLPHAERVTIVHGWNDDIVPVESSIKYAQTYKCDLHILNSDHRLIDVLSEIENLFAAFLDKVKAKERYVKTNP